MADIGNLALRLALVIALLGIGAGVHAGLSGRLDWARVSERALWLVFGLATLAMAMLFAAFATHDFQIAYVASHSARSMALHYRLAALWGGQDGSLLLWLWMLTAYATTCTWHHRHRNRTLMPWVVAVLLVNAAFFLVLTSFVTSPFQKLPPGEVLSDGTGLNPLLQHPVMMSHPPVLYAGLVGFAVPFAFAFAAMISGELGTDWFRTTRRWTLFAWFCLSMGILLGGRWAYEVLGWGGYWAWDPVENASLMPWLVATAYLHSVMVQEKRDMLKIWNLLLIGLTYALCLFGTFITRSGVVQSVHAFAQSPIFTWVFLSYVLATAAVFLAALLWRRQELRSSVRLESLASREASFLLNNWVFIAILMVVFWGTLFPMFSEAIVGRRIAVGPKFFNTMAGPLALFMLFLTGAGPLVAWRRASSTNLRRQFLWPTAAAVAAGAAFEAFSRGAGGYYPLAVWVLSAFVIGTIVQEYARAIGARVHRGDENALRAFATLLRRNQQRYGGYIVHLGVVFILIGTAGSAFNRERLENVRPGDEIAFDGYRLQYLTARPLPARHYGGAVARLALFRDDRPLGVMVPEKRLYWLEQQPASIPAVYSTLREDLYVTLTAVEADGSATLKIHRNPLVNWLWIGGITFALGTAAVMWPRASRGGASEKP